MFFLMSNFANLANLVMLAARFRGQVVQKYCFSRIPRIFSKGPGFKFKILGIFSKRPTFAEAAKVFGGPTEPAKWSSE